MCTGSNQRDVRVDNGESRGSTNSDLGLNDREMDILLTDGPGDLIGTNSTCTKRCPKGSMSLQDATQQKVESSHLSRPGS